MLSIKSLIHFLQPKKQHRSPIYSRLTTVCSSFLLICLLARCAGSKGGAYHDNAFAFPCLTPTELLKADALKIQTDTLEALLDSLKHDRQEAVACPKLHATNMETWNLPNQDDNPQGSDVTGNQSEGAMIVPTNPNISVDVDEIDTTSLQVFLEDLQRSMDNIALLWDSLELSSIDIEFTELDKAFDAWWKRLVFEEFCYLYGPNGERTPQYTSPDPEALKRLCDLNPDQIRDQYRKLNLLREQQRALDTLVQQCFNAGTSSGRNKIEVFLRSYDRVRKTGNNELQHYVENTYDSLQLAAIHSTNHNLRNNSKLYYTAPLDALFTRFADLPATAEIRRHLLRGIGRWFKSNLEASDRQRFLHTYQPNQAAISFFSEQDSMGIRFLQAALGGSNGISRRIDTQLEFLGYTPGADTLHTKEAYLWWVVDTTSFTYIIGNDRSEAFDIIQQDANLAQGFACYFANQHPGLSINDFSGIFGEHFSSYIQWMDYPNPYEWSKWNPYESAWVAVFEKRKAQQYEGIEATFSAWKLEDIRMSAICQCPIEVYVTVTAPHATMDAKNHLLQWTYFLWFDQKKRRNFHAGTIDPTQPRWDQIWAINSIFADIQDELRNMGIPSLNVQYALGSWWVWGSSIFSSEKFWVSF